MKVICTKMKYAMNDLWGTAKTAMNNKWKELMGIIKRTVNKLRLFTVQSIHRSLFMIVYSWSAIHAHQEFVVVSCFFQTVFYEIHCFDRIHIARYLRNIHMRSSVVLSSSRSSRRVLDAVMLTAGKIRLLDRLRQAATPCYLYLWILRR